MPAKRTAPSTKGGAVGSKGHAACFSFYPGKNLGAFGEAGAVVTNDPQIAAKIKVLRDHGQETKYHHSVVGWNGRMDGFQAVVLSIKLRHLAKGNDSRRRIAALYGKLLSDNKHLILPFVAEDIRSRSSIFTSIRTKERDKVLQSLAERGVSCGIHYPKPVHLQKAYAYLGLGRGSLPITEKCADEILSLPMFPELTEAQIGSVAHEINDLLPPGNSKH